LTWKATTKRTSFFSPLLDVFHWVCLDKYARSQAPSTAPAGYVCPSCSDCIFPPDNLVSPVADALRETMAEVNWARAGLGMKLLEERVERKPGNDTHYCAAS
jgi:hypothetical protein